jgi:hypothetical protein
MAYAFIEAEKQEPTGNVAMACRLLEVSTTAFYGQRKPSRRDLDDAELTVAIRRLHEASRGVYGAPRIRRDLAAEGVHVGTKRVARLKSHSARGLASLRDRLAADA